MELVKFGKLKEQSYTMKESLRALKTNIQFCGDDIRTLLVTSSVPNEGKSTVALDLARSLTESGNRVLFIDTDMRKSVLAGRLRATAASGGEICGLSHYLSGQRRLEEVMYGTELAKKDEFYSIYWSEYNLVKESGSPELYDKIHNRNNYADI